MKRINNAALFSQPPLLILSRVPILVEVTVCIYIYIYIYIYIFLCYIRKTIEKAVREASQQIDKIELE